jgi:beta-glucanase (GH16 family)
MYNKIGYPNGIIHNLWLYERDPDAVDTTSQWKHLVNGNGKQPYEIDFEIWSSMEGVNTMWDDNAFINYSIVDYMRNPNVKLRPGEMKQMGPYKAERLNTRQAGIPGTELNKSFFESFHTYELFWYPERVVFKLDGKETAVITPDMAAIPDKHMFLWIGSPLYQDGTYYSQNSIPFLKQDKFSVIDYIRIE